MLIIGIGFFITTFFSSRRVSSVITDKEIEPKNASNMIPKTASLSHFPSLGKAKNIPLKEVEGTKTTDIPKANDSKGSSDISESSSGTVDSSQKEELQESFISQQAEESDATYTKLKEFFQQLCSLYAQSDSIASELGNMMDITETGGRIDVYEYSKKLDEKSAIDRQILTICKEVRKITPDAIEVEEAPRRISLKLLSGNLISYCITIKREKLEASLGKMPEDMEGFLPMQSKFLLIPEDENFSYYEARKELERRTAQNR